MSLLRPLFVVFLLHLPLCASTTLELVAGGGRGDGSPATDVSILPRAVLAGDDGTLLIADELFNRIRRVDTDGRLVSIVGNGGYGLGAEGLPALATPLGIVQDLARAPSGRLFFVDLLSHSIRYIDDDGSARTFATAEAPLFASVPGRFSPHSLAIDAAARLHVADRGTNVVWQIDADGKGRRAAGNGHRGFAGDSGPSALAQLADPRAVDVGHGAIWIADTANRRVRVVSPSGRIWTVAGDGSEDPLQELLAPSVATGIKPIDLVSRAADGIYILDELGNQVLRLEGVDFDLADPAQHATLSCVARFDAETGPIAISVDAQGYLLVADHKGRRVLRVDPSLDGSILPQSVIAGNGTPRASGDGGDARNASLFRPSDAVSSQLGSIYLADRGNRLLRRIEQSGTISTPEIPASLQDPMAVVLDSQGRLVVLDGKSRRLWRRDLTGRWDVLLDSTGAFGLVDPTALAVDREGYVLVADAGRRIVARVSDGALVAVAGNGGTRPLGDGGLATSTALLRPVDVDVDDHGVWIVDAETHTLYRRTEDGLLRRWIGTGAAGIGSHGSQARFAALHDPTRVAADGLGGAYVIDSGNRRLVHVDASGVLRVIDTQGHLQHASNLTRLQTGEILVTDDVAHRLLKLRHDIDVAPLAERLQLMDDNFSVRTIGELPVDYGTQVLVAGTGESARILVSYASGVVEISADGARNQLLSASPSGALAAVTVPQLGRVLARVTPSRLGRSKPLALIRYGAGVADQNFDLDDHFDGAQAMVVDAAGHLYLYRDDGSILRLAAEGLLNIPGFASWVPGRSVGDGALQVWARIRSGAVALAAAEGGVIAAAASNGEIWWLQDQDGDGNIDERKVMGRLPQRPTAVAILSGRVYASTASRVYRLTGNDRLEIVAQGFAPRLLSMTVFNGRLLVLEGSATESRLLELSDARGRLQAWPEVVDFGAALLGNSVSRPMLLRNDGTRPVRIRSSHLATASELIEIAPGGSFATQVTAEPDRPGAVNGQIVWVGEAGETLLTTPTRMFGRAPRLVISGDLNYGIAWIGAPTRRSIELLNEGDVTLTIESFDLPAVVSINDEPALPFALEPGQRLGLSLSYAPASVDVLEGSFGIVTDNPSQPQVEVTMTGQGGRGLLSIDGVEEGIDFGSVAVGDRRRLRLILRNDGDIDLRIGQIVAGSQRLVITPRELTVQAGGQAHVDVDFLPLVHGELKGYLSLFTDDPTRPQRAISYHGRGISDDIEISTTSHDFGATPAGTTTRLQIEVTNHRSTRLRLTSVRTSGRAFRVLSRPAAIAAGERGVIEIGFSPGAGVVHGTVRILTDAPQAPELTVSLQGRPMTATALRLDMPETPVALWPEDEILLPVHLAGVQGLRGVVFTLEGVPSSLRYTGADTPSGSLLHMGDAPLVVALRHEDQLRIGLSMLGEHAAEGDGLAAVLRFSLSSDSADDLAVPIAATIDVEVRNTTGDADLLATGMRWPHIERRGDLDGNGSLEVADVQLLLHAIWDRSHIDRIEAYDLNDDGRLSRDDIDALLLRLPVGEASRSVALLDGRPTQASLAPAHPNPFNAETVLLVELPHEAAVRLEIHNTVGQRVRTIVGSVLPAGRHRIVWNGRNDDGHSVRTGVYFASLQAADVHVVRRLLLLR